MLEAAVTLAGSAGVQAAVTIAGAVQPVALNARLPATPTCRVPVVGPVNSGARPVRQSRVLGLDFAYVSFVVYGEWL